MTTTFFSGDTVRIKVTFKDSLNVLTDPDDNEAFFQSYNSDNVEEIFIESVAATRSSQGIYYYDYTLPDTEEESIKIIVEMRGLFATKPQLERSSIKVKFKG